MEFIMFFAPLLPTVVWMLVEMAWYGVYAALPGISLVGLIALAIAAIALLAAHQDTLASGHRPFGRDRA
jgi:hypothetical protein